MKKKIEPYPSWEEFKKQKKRIAELEKKVEQLLEVVDISVDQTETKTEPDPEPTRNDDVPENPEPSSSESNGSDMSPAIQSIVEQMRSGDNDRAFREFQALDREELAKNPVTAATIAAAICVTQGDFQAGIKALEQVQQYSEDPRIEQIRLKLVEQASKK